MLDPKRNIQRSPPLAVAPFNPEMLAARSEIKRMQTLARRLPRPAYVYTDAAFRDGRAGVAYSSRALGNQVAVVASKRLHRSRCSTYWRKKSVGVLSVSQLSAI